jgi:hypothetical protein
MRDRMDDALEVAVAALGALDRGEWKRVAKLTDPDEVEGWYRPYVEREEPAPRTLTPEQIKRYQPDLPDAVAEYQAAQFNRQQEQNRGWLHGQFAGVATRTELAALSPVEALARYLQAQDPEWHFQEQLKTLDRALAPFARPGTFSTERKVVGVVYEGDGVAHVVYRSLRSVGEANEMTEGTMHVATLRKRPDGWKLRMRGEMFEHGGNITIVEAPETNGAE